ncbi:MAG: YebC/PmpR family DNA-binding transcriptional regulator [Planctomycetota bacterium]|nr:MAG: YebC/PmpR family DNA-binding transcriptional regulator [Planctomycetota bacterium]
MAGHSHWSSIKHKKAAVDAKKGKIFSKLARLITIAVKEGGPDPDANLRLRYVIDQARAANMPMDNINRAIKRAVGDTSADKLEEVVYEGYGPGGVALMVFALTDNRNRTAPELRKLFENHGGNLGQSGSVSWMFNRVGFFSIKKEAADEDAITEAALEGGADDIAATDEYWEIYCAPSDFESVRKALDEAGIPYESAEVTQLATTEISVEPDVARRVLKLISALEDHDDVQNVYNNMKLTEEVIAELNREV